MNFWRVVGLVLLMFWLVVGPLLPEDAGDSDCCCASSKVSSQRVLSELPDDCCCGHASCRPLGAAEESHVLLHRGRLSSVRRTIWLTLLGLLLVWKWLCRLQSSARPGPWSRQRRPGPIPELLQSLLNLPPPFVFL